MLAQKTCWIPFASENRSAQETSSHHFSKRCSRIRNQICSLCGFYHVCNALTLNQINSYVYRIFLYENWLVVEEMIARTVRSFHLILRVFFSTMHLADRRRQSGSLFLQLCMQKISIWLTVAASVVWPCVWTICSLSVCHTLHMLLMPYHSMYIYIYIYIWHTFSRCPRNGESRVD